MLCAPTASAALAHCAVRLPPNPVSATAEQPLIEFGPSLKLTVPVGALPLTVAVKVTAAPADDGVSEVASEVALVSVPITCDRTELVETALFASPP